MKTYRIVEIQDDIPIIYDYKAETIEDAMSKWFSETFNCPSGFVASEKMEISLLGLTI